jgi:DNA-binding MarR family transcriptional regulator
VLPDVRSAGRVAALGAPRCRREVLRPRSTGLVAMCNSEGMQSKSAASLPSTPVTRPARDELVDAVLGASRALVAVAARSLATVAEDVSLAQYRFLVVLASRGPERLADLATAVGVDRSTATRMCDRLVRKRLVTRRRSQEDRRTVRISLTQTGGELVSEVTRRRRAEIAAIVQRIPVSHRDAVLVALRAFADAAGEVPEQDWSLGWDLER